MSFISVDLPAPFSPMIACTSPGMTVRLMSVSTSDRSERLGDAPCFEHGHRSGDCWFPRFHHTFVQTPPAFDDFTAASMNSIPASPVLNGRVDDILRRFLSGPCCDDGLCCFCVDIGQPFEITFRVAAWNTGDARCFR